MPFGNIAVSFAASCGCDSIFVAIGDGGVDVEVVVAVVVVVVVAVLVVGVDAGFTVAAFGACGGCTWGPGPARAGAAMRIVRKVKPNDLRLNFMETSTQVNGKRYTRIFLQKRLKSCRVRLQTMPILSWLTRGSLVGRNSSGRFSVFIAEETPCSKH
jgi:hypothetical protein